MARPIRPAANDARAASGQGMDPTRDLFADLDAEPAAPPAPVCAEEYSPSGAAIPPQEESRPAEDAPAPPTSGPRISYAEAQRLMAIGRSQGPQALTPDQHHALWDCLRELPESQAWLAAQLTALQGELQERGLRPRQHPHTAR